jgi:hypothetical protein
MSVEKAGKVLSELEAKRAACVRHGTELADAPVGDSRGRFRG